MQPAKACFGFGLEKQKRKRKRMRMRWGVQMPKLPEKSASPKTFSFALAFPEKPLTLDRVTSPICASVVAETWKLLCIRQNAPKNRIPHTHSWPKVSPTRTYITTDIYSPPVAGKQELALIINFNLITKTEFNPFKLCRWLAYYVQTSLRTDGVCVLVWCVGVCVCGCQLQRTLTNLWPAKLSAPLSSARQSPVAITASRRTVGQIRFINCGNFIKLNFVKKRFFLQIENIIIL